jgi:hypothetical protein
MLLVQLVLLRRWELRELMMINAIVDMVVRGWLRWLLEPGVM